MTPDQRQHAVYQLLAFVISQRAKRPALSKVFRLVSVTPRTAQRALAGDLYRQHRGLAAQYASPAPNNISFFHYESLLSLMMERRSKMEDRGWKSRIIFHTEHE